MIAAREKMKVIKKFMIFVNFFIILALACYETKACYIVLNPFCDAAVAKSTVM
jgi:hypothetical protein